MIIENYTDWGFEETDAIDSNYSLDDHYFFWYGNYTETEIEDLLECWDGGD